ncbi:hypothetical protein GW17_00010411 [Ensete ventricosum]|nr:hypothetical protein GW17_00010411 [Ensete ventricosum]
MAKHRGESSKMGQAGPLPQTAASGLQVQTRSQTAGAAHEERDSEHDEREVGYPRAKEAQSGAPTRKRSHKERLSTVETRLDVLEASLEELYQGQGRLLGVESLQKEAESRIDRVESLVDRLTEDTKDSVRHLHEVMAKLTAKVTLRFALLSGKTLYRLVCTGPIADRYADRLLPGSTTKMDRWQSIEGEKEKKKKKRRRRKKKKRIHTFFPGIVLAHAPSPPTRRPRPRVSCERFFSHARRRNML